MKFDCCMNKCVVILFFCMSWYDYYDDDKGRKCTLLTIHGGA